MTPLHILIGIHYHCSGDGLDYCAGTPHGESETTKEYCAEMVAAGLLKENHGASAVNRKYEPAEGLPVWIDALQDVPFPALKWVKQ